MSMCHWKKEKVKDFRSTPRIVSIARHVTSKMCPRISIGSSPKVAEVPLTLECRPSPPFHLSRHNSQELILMYFFFISIRSNWFPEFLN